jgi:transcriptional regulator with XRE-family HTH domain
MSDIVIHELHEIFFDIYTNAMKRIREKHRYDMQWFLKDWRQRLEETVREVEDARYTVSKYELGMVNPFRDVFRKLDLYEYVWIKKPEYDEYAQVYEELWWV